MRKDERDIFEAMMAAVQGREVGPAANAAMNVLANLIVTVSPTAEQARQGADVAAGRLKKMVPLIWKETHGASPAKTTDSAQ